MPIHHARRRPGPVVVDDKVLLSPGLSLADLGLYVKLDYLLEGLEDDAPVDRVVQELLAGAAGLAPEASAEDLRAGIERLAAAGFFDPGEGDGPA